MPDGSTQWLRVGLGTTDGGLAGGRVTGGRLVPGSGPFDGLRTADGRCGTFAGGLARGGSLDADGEDDSDGSNGLGGGVGMDAMVGGTVPAVSSFGPLWKKRMVAAAMKRARAAIDPPPRTIQRNA